MKPTEISKIRLMRSLPQSKIISPSKHIRVTFGSIPNNLKTNPSPLATLPPSKRQLTTNRPNQHVTPPPNPGVQFVQRGPTPSFQTYTKFHDGDGITTPSKKSQNNRRHGRKKNRWEKLLCIKEMEELARRGPKMPNLRAIADGWSRRGRGAYRPRNQYEFRDGPRLVSIDTTEDNWDFQYSYPDNLLPARDGPCENRGADDFGITALDLCPWITNLFESCCAEKKKTRALIRPQVLAKGPRLETVCLDCGTVLEHHAMPQGLTRNALGERMDWSHLGGGTPGVLEHVDAEKLPRFEGYGNWQVAGGCDHQRTAPPKTRTKHVPLPAFQAGLTRVFNNAPTPGRGPNVIDSDFHNVDETGHVILPNFPKANSSTKF